MVLRAFELVLDLGIIYHKSRLNDINSNNNFLEVASFFLSGMNSVQRTLNMKVEFMVASCYAHYAAFRVPLGSPNRYNLTLGLVWKLEVTFKIKAFDWRLLVNRLPSSNKGPSSVQRYYISYSYLKVCFLWYRIGEQGSFFFLSVMWLRMFGGRYQFGQVNWRSGRGRVSVDFYRLILVLLCKKGQRRQVRSCLASHYLDNLVVKE